MVPEVTRRANRQVQPEPGSAAGAAGAGPVEAILGWADQRLEELEQPLPVGWEERRRMLG